MFKIICVTNRNLCDGDFLKQMKKIAGGKPDAVILREKDLPEEDYSSLAEKVMDICGEAQVRCILHSYASAAASLGADSLHLPLPLLKDTDAAVIRGFDTLGVSCHSAADVSLAEKLGATYVTAGHTFETDCKRDIPPRGLGLLSDITETANIPVYAIGGINADNIALTKDVGASGACIMSGLMRSDDPAAFIEHLRSRVI